MIVDEGTPPGVAGRRELRTEALTADLVVVGGGLAGTCAAIVAARHGARVTLVQDRPVLGGNASSEVRLWALGATSHLGNNNRWSREGGLINEIMVENTFRNPEGNAYLFDTILLEKALAEPNLRLLLNTAVYDVQKQADSDRIASVSAFCSQNSTRYEIAAPLFCDASGDGIVGFLAGAAFRMGAEAQSELGEKFAPSKEYGELLGHSLYFYTKETDKPVRYIPPAYALTDVEKNIPRFRSFNTANFGCRLWWIEYGGRLDTVHETETIKWELWKVVYGVWDYIKNSGKFPDAANLTLEWVGTIPGKRESRRFEGDYLIKQQDLVEQAAFPDVVAFGGWSIDLHPADGVFSEKPGCNQWHSKGIYGIPYRALYSRNIPNLFLAGRIISASHVAFGSTRVMVTCAHTGQAVGAAAALCARRGLSPRDLSHGPNLADLQRVLLQDGQHLPLQRLVDRDDLAQTATITATSQFTLGASELPASGDTADGGADLPLSSDWAMLFPLPAGPCPVATFTADVASPTEIVFELRTSERTDNFTPDQTLARRTVSVAAGANQAIVADFSDVVLDRDQYAFYCVMANDAVTLKLTDRRVTGLLSVVNRFNPAVAKGSRQAPKEDIGVDTFEFWCPVRRPEGRNLAVSLAPPLGAWKPENVASGVQRPTNGTNAWVAAFEDAAPALTLAWDGRQTIRTVVLSWDADWDHPMETVLMGHPEAAMPFCVRDFRLLDGAGNTLAEVRDNHQTRTVVTLAEPVTTDRLVIECQSVWGAPIAPPAALFEVRCYP